MVQTSPWIIKDTKPILCYNPSTLCTAWLKKLPWVFILLKESTLLSSQLEDTKPILCYTPSTLSTTWLKRLPIGFILLKGSTLLSSNRYFATWMSFWGLLLVALWPGMKRFALLCTEVAHVSRHQVLPIHSCWRNDILQVFVIKTAQPQQKSWRIKAWL